MIEKKGAVFGFLIPALLIFDDVLSDLPIGMQQDCINGM
jgi:hypothetical protein